MKYVIEDIVLELGQGDNSLRSALAKRLRLPETTFRYEITGEELLIQNGKRYISYRVNIDTLEFIRDTSIRFLPDVNRYSVPRNALKDRPVIVGAGLSGLFCAYTLALAGAKPIILEKGKPLAQRLVDVSSFEKGGAYNKNSNYRYGEGGILALSGFRLNRYEDSLSKRWIIDLVEKYCALSSTHRLGFISPRKTQILVSSLLKEIQSRGGEIFYGCEVVGAKTFLGKIKEVKYKTGLIERMVPTNHLILACGEDNIPLYNEVANKNEKQTLTTLSFFLEKDLSEFTKTTIGSIRENPRIPPYFVSSPSKSKTGVETMFSFYYPHARPLFVGSPGAINLSLSMAQEGVNSGVAVISLRPGKAISPTMAKAIPEVCFKNSLPFQIPGETIKDFLSGKPPLRLGMTHPSYVPGVYLADYATLLGLSIHQALSEEITRLSREYLTLTDGRALLLGPSLVYENGRRLLENERGTTCVKGLYLVAPKRSWDYDGVETAASGVEVGTSVLEGK